VSRLTVMVHDAWDRIPMPFNGDQQLAEVKRQALEAARVTTPDAEYVIKFRGAALPDESLTVHDAAIPEGASLIVLRRRRRPVA
jgi:hypothetical protein